MTGANVEPVRSNDPEDRVPGYFVGSGNGSTATAVK